MCKKLTSLILTLMISLSVCACGASDSDMDIYEKIHKTYSHLESYSADLDLTVFSNKTENRYFVSQKTKEPDRFYTLVTDDKGTFSVTTVTNGDKTSTSAEGFDYTITVPSEEYLSLLFVNNFLRAYYASEDTSVTVDSSLTKGDNTVLTVAVNENDLSISEVSMAFDNKTLAPSTVTVYGEGGKTLATAKYENFKFDDKIDDSVFNTY